MVNRLLKWENMKVIESYSVSVRFPSALDLTEWVEGIQREKREKQQQKKSQFNSSWNSRLNHGMGSPNTSTSGRPLGSVIKPDRRVTESADEASALCASSLVFATKYSINTNIHAQTYRPNLQQLPALNNKSDNGSNSNQDSRIAIKTFHPICLISTETFCYHLSGLNDSLLCLSTLIRPLELIPVFYQREKSNRFSIIKLHLLHQPTWKRFGMR